MNSRLGQCLPLSCFAGCIGGVVSCGPAYGHRWRCDAGPAPPATLMLVWSSYTRAHARKQECVLMSAAQR